MPEFDLIDRLERIICLPEGELQSGCRVGIGDDAAVLEIPEGQELVVSTDTLVEGVHFPAGTPAESIGYKALAVNLSDLASMGAKPTCFFLALTLPREDARWLDEFSAGMAGLARQWRVQLAGGDTTTGPLSMTITALGTVNRGRALLRSGARAGDLVVISGAPGVAARALEIIQAGREPAAMQRKALDYPQPRVDLGQSLAGLATSCIDLSDGLAADLVHILDQSGVGAEIELGRLPVHEGLAGLTDQERWRLQLSGGDDYELCFTVPADSTPELNRISDACDIELTPVGTIVQGSGLELKTEDGASYDLASTGYIHFSGGE